MRNTLIAAVAALVLAAPALADDWDFILTNATGKEIKTIELSPAGANTWQPNKIDTELRKDGAIKAAARSTIHFDKADKQCKYDVKATFADDTTQTWTNINVCDDSYVTLRYGQDGAPTFAAN